MSILLGCIIWYLIGFIPLVLTCIISGEFTINDLLHCFIIGFLGPIILIALLLIIIVEYMDSHNISFEKILDIPLYKRNK